MILWARGLLAAVGGRTRRLVTRCALPLLQQVTSTRTQSLHGLTNTSTQVLQRLTSDKTADEEKVQKYNHQSRPTLVNNIAQLAAVFLLEAAALRRSVRVYQGAWLLHVYEASRPDLREVFGGHAEISWQASKAGLLVMQPLDILWGCDWRDKGQREKALQMQRKHRPRLLVIQFPCTV